MSLSEGLWKVHGDGKHIPPTEVVAPEERLAWPQTIGLGFQHVLAMFGATFIVPVLIGFPPNTTIFFSGIGTLIFLLITIGRGQRLGLPSYLGSSFAFISPVLVAEQKGGIPSALAGIFVAGAVFFVIGLIVNKWGTRFIEWLMPPVVTGAVVSLIGLNLAPSAFANFDKQPWTAFATLCVIVLVTVLFRGFIGRLSILVGVVFGYLIAWGQGQISFTSVRTAGWIGLPKFNSPHFSMRPIFLIVPVVIVLIAENTGHIKAVATMTDRNLDRSLGRGYMGDGLATMLAGLGGGSGTTTYAENIGVMAATKVYSTAAYYVAGIVAIALRLHPEVRGADLDLARRCAGRCGDDPVRPHRRSRRPYLGREPGQLLQPGQPVSRRYRPRRRRRELHAHLRSRQRAVQRHRHGRFRRHHRLPADELDQQVRRVPRRDACAVCRYGAVRAETVGRKPAWPRERTG